MIKVDGWVRHGWCSFLSMYAFPALKFFVVMLMMDTILN